ncbi:ABC transporter permease [Demequina sp.]|uniref:ABC transporter permease n=1 Tax=Demequina sp. TaxID=2050685 RepID=UPI0025C376BF|nr:ABC transporter permease [Demequina sp.]
MIALLEEVLRDARARRGATALAIATTAVAYAATLLIFGSSVAAGFAALDALESVDSRTIVVRFDSSLDVSLDDVRAVQALEPVSAMVVLGPARDAWSTAVGPRRPVALRTCLAGTEAVCEAAPDGVAIDAAASRGALDSMGFTGSRGVLEDSTHAVYVVDEARTSLLTYGTLDNTAIATGPASDQDVALIVIEAASSQHVRVLTSAIADSLSGFDGSKISIESSPEIGDLRSRIAGSSFESARFVTLAIMVGGAAVLALSELAVARSRRRTMGLRRAIGASRRQLALGILLQGILTGAVGITIGGGVSLWILAITGVAVSLTFAAAVAVILQTVVVAASAVPAAYASRRDPARELRIP